MQSQTLVNATHYDVDDKTISIATWTELDIGKATKWYFILPNVTRDGCKGIAINLSNGMTIVWDGQTIFHCLTVGDVGMANNLYGTFLVETNNILTFLFCAGHFTLFCLNAILKCTINLFLN